MAQIFAKDQPKDFQNHVKNITIVGAGGQCGSRVAADLVKSGKFNVSAITREGSDSKLADGVTIKPVDYDDQSTIVKALQDQDVLIITMAVTAPKDTQSKLIRAAAEAGVPWVLPNEWGADYLDESYSKESLIGEPIVAARREIEELGKSSWIAMVCNFWYQYSLGTAPGCYGFDFKNKAATFYDEGKVKMPTTSWEQCGRATTSLLSLKVYSEDENDKSLTISSFKNDFVYFSSFYLSQEEMFESILRVTGDKKDDWKITYQPAAERYQEGFSAMNAGDYTGFMKVLYSRGFYKSNVPRFEMMHHKHNDVLGLPQEDLDEATLGAIEISKTSKW